jgi:SAM-dependent methyltransferase
LRALSGNRQLRLLDLGCGCGGWMRELTGQLEIPSAELAVADSSLEALRYVGGLLPERVARYQTDVMNVLWENRWNVVFLLDVIEHLPDDRGALRQVWKALEPGGIVFLTTPALQRFWTWNDEVAGHQRRYSKADFVTLSRETGFELCDCRYFMFFLSPLLVLSRWLTRRRASASSPDRVRELMRAMHRVPSPVANTLLGAVFACETPLGHYLPFPWGTSLLGVFRKPATTS